MDTLKAIQAIIELVHKRPLVSFICLACLLLMIFSPLILRYAPSNTPNFGQHETQTGQSPVASIPVRSTPPESNQPFRSNATEDAGTGIYSQSAAVRTYPPADQTFSPDKYFIVAASKPTEQSAVEYARSHGGSSAEVYQTPNGWYAITVGHYSLEEARRVMNEKIADGSIPDDAWVSNGLTPGREWLGRVYP